MKTALNIWSYRNELVNGKHTWLSLIDKAKELGFDAIEFVDMDPKFGVSFDDTAKNAGLSSEELALEIKDKCKKANLTISSFTFPADILNGSNGNIDKEIERIIKRIDLAYLMGAKLIRHDATLGHNSKSFDMVLPILADSCRKITEYAMTKGIRTTIENHGYFCQDSLRMERLYNAVNHPNFGILCDIGNFVTVGESPDISCSIVAPYVFYVHVKDFIIKSGMDTDPGQLFGRTRNGNYIRPIVIGHGNVPVKQCLFALKKANYNGYIGIEIGGGIEDADLSVKISLENVKRYINEI